MNLKNGRTLLTLSSLVLVLAGCGGAPAASTTDLQATSPADTAQASVTPSAAADTQAPASAAPSAATTAAGDLSFPLPEQQTLNIAISKWGPHGAFEEMSVPKEWETKTNLVVDWIVIPIENKDEKVPLMFATGDLPDAFFGLLSTSDVINYGTQGLIIPLEDLIDQHMPNLKALLDKRPALRAALTASDGHIYSFPKVDETEAEEVLNKAYINAEWLQTLGLEMPTTTDEYYAVLKAFKERDPNGNGEADEIPFTALGNWGPEFSFGLYSMYHAFDVPDTPNHIAVVDGKVVYAPMLPGYRDAMAYFNKLYTEGLADVELFTQDFKQMTSKGHAKPLVYGSFVSYLDTVTSTEDADDAYEVLPPLKGPNGDQSWPRMLGRMYQLNTGQISKDNAQPELTAAWIDRFYEPKQSAINIWGAVGEVLEEDASGMLTFNPTPDGMTFAEFRHATTPGGILPGANLKEHWNTVIELPIEKVAVTEDIQAFVPHLSKENFPFIFFFATDEEQELGRLRPDIERNVEEVTSRWITSAPPSDSEWNAYLESMKAMGVEQLLAVYQGAYDRYQAAQQ